MRHVLVFVIAATLAAQDKKPQEKLVFQYKGGEAVFTHAAHTDREKGACATCHPKLWPQSANEPLKNSDGCKTCHKAGGASFEMKGNCVKCHPNGTAKTP